jgi:hypothetical protein
MEITPNNTGNLNHNTTVRFPTTCQPGPFTTLTDESTAFIAQLISYVRGTNDLRDPDAAPTKLPHRLIVLTGGIASGKTTVCSRLAALLREFDKPYKILSSEDVYTPFCMVNGLLLAQTRPTQTVLTRAVLHLYSQYGPEVGSALVYIHLRTQSSQSIYILDSIQTPLGLCALNKLFSNYLSVGVSSSFSTRLNRLLVCPREFDASDLETLNSARNLLISEHRDFSISASLALSHILIENDSTDPASIDVELTNALFDHRFLPPSAVPVRIPSASLPQHPTCPSGSSNVLTRDHLRSLLDDLRNLLSNCTVVIIQSGNRYIHAFFDLSGHPDVHSIKATSLAKCPPFKILNSLLTPAERQGSLPKQTVEEMLVAFESLPAETRGSITTASLPGFENISDLLRYGTTAEVVQALSSVPFELPFTEPSNDTTRPSQMKKVLAQISLDAPTLPTDQMLSTILRNSTFARSISRGDRPIAFVDHLFYRGRTLLTISWLMQILRIPPKHWRLYALCADEVAASFQNDRLTILAPATLYPFENSIATEGGYWDEVASHFIFRDLWHYYRLLRATTDSAPPSPESSGTITLWMQHLREIDRLASVQLENEDFRLSLIGVLIHSKAIGSPLPLETLSDQRAYNLGYCTPFASFCLGYICQSIPASVRRVFNDNVTQSATVYNKILSSADANHVGRKAVHFYKENRRRIDDFYLQQLFPQSNTVL